MGELYSKIPDELGRGGTIVRIIVTGGNGYVGREVTRRLMRSHTVRVVDSLRYGTVRFTPDEMSAIDFQKIDINDPEAVRVAFETFEPEAVVHLAAIHYIPECEQDPSLAVRTNVLGTQNILAACPSGCRVVFASSGAVYKPDDRPHREDTALIEPSDIYGFSKLHGEHYVRYAARTHGLSAVIVRLFNVIGPGETNPHLLPEIVAQLKSGRTTISLGNLWPKRDYIHVQDAAAGFVATTLNSDVVAGETVTVNLGTSHSYSVAEIIGKLKAITGSDFTLIQDDTRKRAVDRPFLAADNGRIRDLFGWSQAYTIDEALSNLWRDPELSIQLTEKYACSAS
ncbi:NAD-dependent epimerase/dehydratase family protein [Methylorubrum populi]